MTAYNKVNGYFTASCYDLTTSILREEWGFDGLTVSDWANWAEHYREIKAGNNLRMPVASGRRLLKAYDEGLVTREEMEQSAKQVLKWLIRMA